MSQSTACVFPETVPREDQIAPLVQVFAEVVHLQAVEDEPPAAAGALLADLYRRGRLRLVTPAPLGDQRDCFLALVRDMEQRRDDYLSQLALLTLADLHRTGRPESGRSIVSDLLSRAALGDRQDAETATRLWQARLVLKLGELFDAEQAGLNEALQAIDRRQETLLAELREETDELFALTDSLQEGGQRTEAMLSHRLKAWSRLFFHRPQPPAVFVTAHRSALETLADGYESLRRQPPQPLVSLELPTTQAEPPLIAACPSLRAALAAALAGKEVTAAAFRQGAAEWVRHLDQVAPSPEDRCRLDLFECPGISARQLFLGAFAGEREALDTTLPGERPLTLVGALTTD